jgi:HD-like signal output (HDOD) protein
VDAELRRSLEERIEGLTVLPTIANKLIATLQAPDADPREVAKVASTDPAIATEILRTVNSSFYGLREKVSDLSRAILMLGYSQVKFLVLRFGMGRSLASFSEPKYEEKLTALWRHAFLVSEIVGHLLRRHVRLPHLEASTPALLHDLGKLLLLDVRPRSDFDAGTVFQSGSVLMEQRVLLEEDYYGVNHCLIGSRIAQKLNLSDLVRDVLAYHHHNLDAPEVAALRKDTIQVIAMVKLADSLVHDLVDRDPDELIQGQIGPDMTAYQKHFQNLPAYSALLEECRPAALKLISFLDSILPVQPAPTPAEGDLPAEAQVDMASDRPVTRMLARRYALLEELGAGSLGVVHLCEDRFLGQQFAIKILHPELLQSTPAALQSFRNEALVSMRLQHRHIARVFHFDFRDGTCFILREYVKGQDLSAILQSERGGRMSETEVLRIASALAEALRYAHGMGVIHRDLNPSNVLVDEEGAVKLLDFGVAACKVTESFESVSGAAGTPHYMSPEHWEGSEHVRPASDVYSFGVLLYHLLTGNFPFEGRSAAELREAQRTATPRTAPHVSPETMALIARCLRPAIAERWQGFDAVAGALEQAGRALVAATEG